MVWAWGSGVCNREEFRIQKSEFRRRRAGGYARPLTLTLSLAYRGEGIEGSRVGNMPLLIDGLIIIVYFTAITSIGLYMGRREKSLHDFALGGRSMPWWAVMASIIAAETSAATFIGTPGEGYEKRSLAYTQLILGLILGRVLVAYIFLKPYYLFKVYTVYDYLAI